MIKKAISVLLVITLLCGLLSASAAAQGTQDITRYPVVIVPGYSSSQLYYTGEDGSKQQVWWIGTDAILAEVYAHIAEVGLGLGLLAAGRADYIADTVGKSMLNLCGRLACNDDGSSRYNLSLYYTSAEDTCSAKLAAEYPDGNFRHEVEIMDAVSATVGNDNIFNFNCDFRLSVEECAAKLDEYIKDVLRVTGSEKVNIIAVSQGGQVTATYLTLYGEQRLVDNVVLNVPAIGGAGLAYDVLAGGFAFDVQELLRYVEYGMLEETDYHWLAWAQQMGFLNDILNAFQPYALELVGNWKSLWDMVPAPYYEALKEKYLDSEKNAAIIASSDRFHHEILTAIPTGLRRCAAEYGMNISIIAGTDHAVVTGLQVNSDAIIPTFSSTGALTAPAGQRFADGYTSVNGKDGYVSPSMTVDASAAYLPDNTWFVSGLFHGMEYKDPYSAGLLLKLLLTDDITSVYCDPAYPRFHATTNVSTGVFAAFDASPDGFVGATDSMLNITNLSAKYRVKILRVDSGLGLRFDVSRTGCLAPGESVRVAWTGTMPAVSKTCRSLTVSFLLLGSPTPLDERTFYFTLTNGPAPVYDADNPFTALCADSVACPGGDNGGLAFFTQWNSVCEFALSFLAMFEKLMAAISR